MLRLWIGGVVASFACFLLGPGIAQGVVINEIHFHPANGVVGGSEDPEDLQFLELYNEGVAAEDLSGWSVVGEVDHVFAAGVTLDAGAHLVLAQDAAFLQSHVSPSIPGGVQVITWDSGGLPNAGGVLTLLSDLLVEQDAVTYDDAAPWPTGSDGFGPSLELTEPGLDNSYGTVWRASIVTNGTPGVQNSVYTEAPILLAELPQRASVITDLSEVAVTFAEPVRNVVPGGLTVNSSLATSVTCDDCLAGLGRGPYHFTGFAMPTSSPIDVALAPGSIEDEGGHPFAGDMWIYAFDPPDIVINELHFNPDGGDDLEEFIELYNADPGSVDVSGWSLREFSNQGFTFPPSTVMAPGGYLVVARYPDDLQAATGFETSYQWDPDDKLSNSGEPVALHNELGIVVDRVVYSDETPWPSEPDGDGPSLELLNPSLDNSQSGAWAAALSTNGTPGSENSVATELPLVLDEMPTRGTAVGDLTEVTVTFSTPVVHVNAGDLLVAGQAATSVMPAVGPATTYTFSGFPPPAPGSVVVALTAGSIESDPGGIAFSGTYWTLSVGLIIVINEIHYHPAAPDDDAEFVELYNAGSNTAHLDNWTVCDGFDMTFPSGATLAPGGYLVLALDAAALESASGYTGALEWSGGRLSNGGEHLALCDDVGNLLDDVAYDDAAPWSSAPDGDGPSLELISPLLPNQFGAAWKASTGAMGTPGGENSCYQVSPPPIILDPIHDPPIPAPLQDVVVTARVIDDTPNPTVTLHHRQDQDPTVAYSSVTMLDDGFHADGAAGDGWYGAIVAGLPDGQRMDFYISATDGVGTTVLPVGHETPDESGYPSQTFLCPFGDATPDPEFPTYHMITTQHTRNLQDRITRTSYDATFIQCGVSGDCEVFYNVAERYRGHSTINQTPHGFRIDFSSEHPLQSEMGFAVTDLVLMAQEIDRQYLGYRFFREAFDGAIPTSVTQFVRFRTSPRVDGGLQGWIYINIERVDEDFMASQGGAVGQVRFPSVCSDTGVPCDDDDDCAGTCVPTSRGNVYRARHTGNLDYRGENPNAYRTSAQPYGGTDFGYDKETNEAEDEWDDLIDLCYAVDAATTPDETFEAAVRPLIDEEEWTQWFAVHMLLGNGEGGLYRDSGDDYFVHFSPAASPYGYDATLIPWDLDSVWGGHWHLDNYWEQPTIWRTACGHPCNPYKTCPSDLADTAGRFIRSNAFAGRMVGAICDLLDGEFAQANVDAMIDDIPDAVLAQSPYFATADERRTKLKDWAAARRVKLAEEIVSQLTLEGVPASPFATGGQVISLHGDVNQCGTHDVVVNGVPVDAFSVFKNPYPSEPCGSPAGGGDWSHQFVLGPGVNDIVVQCLDDAGAEVDRAEGTVTYAPAPSGLRLTAPRRMVEGKPLTVKAELLDANGAIHWRLWNTVGTVWAQRVTDGSPVPTTITVFESLAAGVGGGVPPADSVRLYNGVGSVSITLDDPASVAGQSIRVFVEVEGLVASKVIDVLADVPGTFKALSGALSGADLTWSPGDGVIHLTADVTVPTGETLTIQPGTLVMVDAGPAEAGTRVLLNGSDVDAQGTADEPIYFFATAGPAAMTLPQGLNEKNNPNSWRGFLFEGGGASTFSYVFLTGAGNGAIEFHPRAPVFYLAEGATHQLTLTDSVFADTPGEVVFAKGSGVYTIARCLFSRVGIGGEFVGADDYTVTVEDSWFTRIGRAPEANNVDGDMLHLDQVTTVPQTVRRCIFTDGGDDVIDHSNGAHPTVDSCIIYDARDKAVSLYYSGDITMTNCLIFDVPNGIEATGQPVYLTNCTFGRNTKITDRQCNFSDINKCIFWPVSIVSCCNHVDHSLLGSAGHLGCGTCNLSQDPLFMDAANNDFNLQPASPAIDVCDQGRIGWLGFPQASACSTDEDCDDADACTVDACHLGVCIHGDRDCTAYDDECLRGVCDSETGACVAWPVSDGTPCEDALFCNGVEACVGGVCLAAEDPCDDGITCTVDSCDEVSETCEHVADDMLCDDGYFCNGVETCAAALGCQDGIDPCVDQAHCDEEADVCLSCVNDLDCDNGLFCDGAETCVDHACVVGMDPCDDYVTCTEDVCLEETDTCDHTPMDAWCDNGVFCDGVEVCDTVAGCGDGPDPCVDLAHCDEVGDACYECLSAAECDDGLFCNGAEQCVSHVCLDGLDPCEDSCERCDETEGTCIWCMFDLDFDGFIGPGDFSYLAGCYGAYYDCDPPTYRSGADGCCAANFDGSADSFVGPGDFAGFVGCWGDVCSACSNCWEAAVAAPGSAGGGDQSPTLTWQEETTTLKRRRGARNASSERGDTDARGW